MTDVLIRYALEDLIEDLADIPLPLRRATVTTEGANELSDDQAVIIRRVVSLIWHDGERHMTALALAGWLAQNGISETAVSRMVETCSRDAGDQNTDDRLRVVTDTFARIRAELPTTGWSKLKERLSNHPNELAELDSVFPYVRVDAKPPNADSNRDADGEETSAKSEPEPWPEIIPIDEPPRPPFPTDALPEPLRSLVSEVGESTQTPPDMAALVSLAVCGIPIARRYGVRLDTDWLEPVHLWTTVFAPPGRRKSAVYAEITGIIRQLEREKREATAPEIARRKQKREAAQDRLKDIRAKLKRQQPGSDEYAELEAQLEAATDTLTHLPELYSPAMIVDDITPESLAVVLSRQNERIAIMSDEGGTFQNIAGTYSEGEPRLDVYLKGHSSGYVRVDRITDGRSIALERPALTMATTVQPDVIQALGKKRELKGRGFLARGLYGYPLFPPKRTEKLTPSPVQESTRAAYGDAIRYLERHGADLDTAEAPAEITLSPEARDVFLSFRADVNESQTDGVLAAHEEWAGKLAGHTARVAAVVHAISCASQRKLPERNAIPGSIMASAVRIAWEYLVPHMAATFSLMRTDATTELAKRIVGLVQREGRPEWSRRDIHHRIGGGVTGEELEPALIRLVDYGYIRARNTQKRELRRGRKPSDVFDVNPAILSNVSKEALNTKNDQSLSQEKRDSPPKSTYKGTFDTLDRMPTDCISPKACAALGVCERAPHCHAVMSPNGKAA